MTAGDIVLYRRSWGDQVARVVVVDAASVQVEVWRPLSRDWHGPLTVGGCALDGDVDRLAEALDRLRGAGCAPSIEGSK